MVNGRSEAEADAAALEAAKTFRAELVRSGIVKESKELDPNFTSDVPGVLWSKEKKKWRVEITLKRSNPKEQWSDLGLTVCTLHLESQIGPLLRNKGTNYVFVLLAAYHPMTHANTVGSSSLNLQFQQRLFVASTFRSCSTSQESAGRLPKPQGECPRKPTGQGHKMIHKDQLQGTRH